MTRERKAVQKLDTPTVKEALWYCSRGICSSQCPLYRKGLVCKGVTKLMESALAIIEGEDKRKEQALIDFAENIKSSRPFCGFVKRSTIDRELERIKRGNI